MIGVDDLRQVVGGMIRRRHLIGGHAPEQGIRPTATLPGLLETPHISKTLLGQFMPYRSVFLHVNPHFSLFPFAVSKLLRIFARD